MKVFITGGAGFIGSHLVDLHRNQGDDVTVIDNLSTGHIENIAHHLDKPGFKFHKGSVVDWPGLEKELLDADLVYHLAAVVGVKHVLECPKDVISVNITATDRILHIMGEAGSKSPILLASSSEVYGFNDKAAFDENDDLVLPSTDRLRWCYAVTKLTDEMLAFSANHQYGLKTIAVRLFNTVGPRQSARYGMVLPHFVEECVNNEAVTVYGDGDQTRSFSDVRDTVQMLAELAQSSDAYGHVVNVGNDQEISINDLAAMVKKQVESTSDIIHITYKEAYGTDFRDIDHRRPGLANLHSLIKYRPEFKLEDTIDDLIEFYKAKQIA